MEILNLTLYTTELKRLFAFYSDVLSLSCSGFSQEGFSVYIGSSEMHFLPMENEEENASPYYHFAFNIPYQKMEEALDWLRQRVSILPDESDSEIVEFPHWNARALYFFDSSGNIVELIGRKYISFEESTPFNSSQIFSISEIGIPVPSVKEAFEKTADFLPHYWGNQDVFTAMGDTFGLLIFVDKNKKTWYPTDKKAITFPFKCLINTKYGLKIIEYDNDLTIRPI